jgi:hypothetical protein
LKQKHKPRKATVKVNCPCGMIHQVVLGLGELQLLERGIIKGKMPTLNITIDTFAPTGKTLRNGTPEYLRFNREPSKEHSGDDILV